MRRTRIFWLAIAVIWPVMGLWCLKSGAVAISWSELAGILLPGGEPGLFEEIVLYVRLPRILMAALAGAALSLTGAIFQALLRNALADPYILGISGGAALGVTLSVLFGLNVVVFGITSSPLFAFLGSLASIALIYRFSRTRGVLSVHTMLLVGVSLQAMCSAVVLFLHTIFDPFQLMQVFHWLMGHVPSPSYPTLAVVATIFLVAVVLLLPRARDLNALVLGDRDAMSLGVDIPRLKNRLFLISSLLTGTVVALTGLIGFVGIVVPHVLRLLLGPDYRRLLPASIAGGSLFLVVADTLSRSIVPPAEIPVGVLTALSGGPFFVYLLWRNEGKMGS